MSKYPEISIKAPEKGFPLNRWGEFVYGPKMPWGPWCLTRQPKEVFNSEKITVLECFADEYVEDEQGYVAERALEYDPCLRHFLVGVAPDRSVLWWYNLGPQRYDHANKRFYEATIRIEGKEIIIKGYGWEVEPNVEIHIHIETGAKSSYL